MVELMTEKTEETLTTIGKIGAGLGVGILAWEATATKRFMDYAKSVGVGDSYGLFTKHRFADALGLTIGKKNAQYIFPDQPCGDHGIPQINPLGWANKTVAAGGVALIINAIVKHFYKPYRDFPVVPETVDAAGWGAVIGGAVGGILDPPVNTANYGNGRTATNGSKLPTYQYTAGMN